MQVECPRGKKSGDDAFYPKRTNIHSHGTDDVVPTLTPGEGPVSKLFSFTLSVGVCLTEGM